MKETEILKNYGCKIFSEQELKKRVNEDTFVLYEKIKLDFNLSNKDILDEIVEAIKNWSIELGVTHFTHFFTSFSSEIKEKQQSLIEILSNKPILELTYKSLIKEEIDASSFDNGETRDTYCARGYLSWNIYSNIFVMNNVLYIPSVFSSYNNEALDNKIPLIKSNIQLNKELKELLKLLGKDINYVHTYVGVEQEYYLIDEKLYNQRSDLKLTGRTLFGKTAVTVSNKYLTSFSNRIKDYLDEVDKSLWELGIASKIRHSEVGNNQFEIVCIFDRVNITSYNNSLVIKILNDTATKYGLRCLFHEKPFLGLPGSGKHNNLSLITDTGENLLFPSEKSLKDLSFLAILSCFIKGIDEYSQLINIAINTYSNDLRLGGKEAPVNIVSISLGKQLNKIISSFIEGKENCKSKTKKFDLKIPGIPTFIKDDSDRNRTSPIAFTNNKFEFRGVGSSQSIDFINSIINSILCKEIREMRILISDGISPKDVIKKYLLEHKRIIYEGNCYSDYWKKESLKRGLNSYECCLDSYEGLKNDILIAPLLDFNILSRREIEARYNILLENYCKTTILEADVVIKIISTEIYPLSLKYLNFLLDVLCKLEQNNIKNHYLKKDIEEINNLLYELNRNCEILNEKIKVIKDKHLAIFQKTQICKNEVMTLIDKLRKIVDNIETKVYKNNYPFPSYDELLFGL